jgi:hypothetical protein
VVRHDGEVSGLQYVAEVPHGFVDRQELHVVGAVFLLHRADFSVNKARGCQTPRTRCWKTAPLAVVEAPVTRTSGAVASGYVRRGARDRLALHSSEAVMSAAVQVTGREPLIIGPEMTT